MRSHGKRVTREASRATGTFLFFPKGALTHHPGGAVVFPLETVRSPRGMRLLRQPDGQCHISADLLSLSTQLVEYCRFNRRYSTNCPHKPATAQGTPFGRGNFVCGYDPKFSLGSFSLWKEKQKLYERIGSKKWRSIIWKPRSSAGAQVDLPAPLLPI